jgi:glycerophosphoryl diester phosphodiesterase
MKVREEHLVPRSGDSSVCEDALTVTGDFACVIDGTTTKSALQWDGKKSGRVAAELLSKAVAALPSKITALDAATELTAVIARFYDKHNMRERAARAAVDRITATMALYSRHRREVWMIGDCQCLIGRQHNVTKMTVEEIAANARALYLELELQNGKTREELMERDTGREFIQPLLVRQHTFQNADPGSPYFYSAFDGFHIPKEGVRVIKVPFGITEIVLATDGYPHLRPTLRESEKFLQHVLSTDPLCMNLHRATKGLQKGSLSYDDRAYLRVGI